MAELINQILALPRTEKWRIFAILAEQLRKEEEGKLSTIPKWQIGLAEAALEEIESGKIKTVNQKDFWASIDAKLEQLENQAGK